MQYFTNHPVVAYDLLRTDQPVPATNITSRLILTKIISGLGLVYYDYLVKDGERADTVAFKYYGDERYDWVVYLANNILDPYFQWPLDSRAFEQYLRSQYGSIDQAHQTVHHYEWLLDQKRTVFLETGESVIVTPRTLQVDYTTYVTLPGASRRTVTVFEHEEAINEGRRKIKLLDKDFVPALERRLHILYPSNG